MTRRIHASELERLIADDTVADEAIAPYIKPASVRGLPFEPVLTANGATVYVPPKPDIVGLTVSALNARSNRRREADYKARISGGWKGLKVLAEGDSWFVYPILLHDIVDNLSNDYAIYSVAAAGDALDNIVRGAARIEELVQGHGFDAVLLSAGGNEIVGDPLRSYIRPAQASSSAPDDYITEAFDAFLAGAKARVSGVLDRLTKRFPRLHIFGHGYDSPSPRRDGIWLEPALSSHKIPEAVRGPILGRMIDRYYGMLKEVETQFNGQFHVVDCRNAVGTREQWFDELHPLNPGFARAADRFRMEIDRVFGMSRQVRITWRPSEETTGARTRSQTYPHGAMITVGRNAEREIVLDDDRVSRSHVRLVVGASSVEVEDLGSSNGTLIEGRRTTKATWLPGQKLRIGPFVFALSLEPPAKIDVAGPTASDGGVEAPSKKPEAAASSSVALGTPLAGQARAATPPAGEPTPAAERPRQSLDIVLSKASIIRQSSRAWAIGVFENVNPLATRGAARAIDEYFDGIVSNVLEGRIVEGRLGPPFCLPIHADPNAARNLFLAGLGAISDFGPSVVEAAGESLARLLTATHVFELATVPMGLNSGLPMHGSVEGFLTGFLRGLYAADEGRGFRSLTLCEVKPDRFAELVRQVHALKTGDYFASRGFDVTIREEVPGDRESAPAKEPHAATPGGRVYLNKIYLEVVNRISGLFEYALVGAPGAAAPSFSSPAAVSEGLRTLLDAPDCPHFDAALGRELANAYLPAELQEALWHELTSEQGHLVIIHDGASAAVPWEASFIDGRSVALEIGISRQHKPQTRSSPVKHIDRVKQEADGRLRMLLVYDPTCNLKGAETEAQELTKLFSQHNCEITTLRREQCTKEAVLGEMAKGCYDLLHFAGHARFTRLDPKRSGIVLANETYLSASDLEKLPAVPRLIFLNACQSGRVRGDQSQNGSVTRDSRTDHASLAEGLILRNVKQFIGTYWEVNDGAANRFATSFYSELLAGKPVGESMRSSRKALASGGQHDWVNYLHFGEPGELLRKLNPAPSSAKSTDAGRARNELSGR